MKEGDKEEKKEGKEKKKMKLRGKLFIFFILNGKYIILQFRLFAFLKSRVSVRKIMLLIVVLLSGSI